jgi:uncharacterized small protein (TIGR04563 family)
MLEDVSAEAVRQERSMSWVVQRCVDLALAEVRAYPAVPRIVR